MGSPILSWSGINDQGTMFFPWEDLLRSSKGCSSGYLEPPLFWKGLDPYKIMLNTEKKKFQSHFLLSVPIMKSHICWITSFLLTSWKRVRLVNSYLGFHWEVCQSPGKTSHIEQWLSGSLPAPTPFPQSHGKPSTHSFPWKGIQELRSVPFWLCSLLGGIFRIIFPSIPSCLRWLGAEGFVINTFAYLPLVYWHCAFFFDGKTPQMYAYKWREERICTAPPRNILVLYACFLSPWNYPCYPLLLQILPTRHKSGRRRAKHQRKGLSTKASGSTILWAAVESYSCIAAVLGPASQCPVLSCTTGLAFILWRENI